MYDRGDNREECTEEERQDGKRRGTERNGNRIEVRGTFNMMRLKGLGIHTNCWKNIKRTN